MRGLVTRLLLGLFQANDNAFLIVASVLLIVEAALSTFVIQKVPYTEIDWSTYMQQVECYLKKGIMNYTHIGGDTGPVVYPAGHIFVYRVLYALTDAGKSIRAAQHIFQGFYLINLFFVFRIFYKTHRMPPVVLFLVSVTGYRIHSIFMLRLFNDPVAMLLFYVAMDQFLDNKWLLGCILYSLAVSIKMNVLLFAPALFFTLLLNTGILPTLGYIAICGAIQLYVGGPFLLYDWKAYVMRSFDLGRVFMFKWTVNWRFLPEELFLDKRFHIALLVGHLTLLALFACFMWFRPLNGLRNSLSLLLFRGITTSTGPTDTLYAFFTANLVGIAFSRSLHYQFYSWYFHQLPFLLFADYPHVASISAIPWVSFFWKVPLLLCVELAWNVYPSTYWSSALLHACHVIILWYLFVSRPKKPIDSVTNNTLRMVRRRHEAVKKTFEEHGLVVPRGRMMDEEEKKKEKQEKKKEKKEVKEEKEEVPMRISRDGLPIPPQYATEKEMNAAFNSYYKRELRALRDSHKVYFGSDGEREVTGLPPIGDGSKLKMHEKVKLLYADALHLKEKIRLEIVANVEQNGIYDPSRPPIAKNGIENGNAISEMAKVKNGVRKRTTPRRAD